jgi:thiol-disulfide isomerase/thioredoxin
VLSKYFIGSEKDINETKIGIFQYVTQAFIDSLPSSLATKNFVNQLDVLVDIRSKTLNLNKGEYMIKYGFYDVPEIRLNRPDGGEIKLSDLKGKTVLVDFWASWCGPCRKENPNVVKLYNKYRKNNFTVFSVSLDQDASKWKQAIKRDQLTWLNHGSELRGWNSSFVPVFDIKSIPFTVLVNPEGKIIGLNLTGPKLEERLYELFKF